MTTIQLLSDVCVIFVIVCTSSAALSDGEHNRRIKRGFGQEDPGFRATEWPSSTRPSSPPPPSMPPARSATPATTSSSSTSKQNVTSTPKPTKSNTVTTSKERVNMTCRLKGIGVLTQGCKLVDWMNKKLQSKLPKLPKLPWPGLPDILRGRTGGFPGPF